MEYESACGCGKAVTVSEGMAGTSVLCSCGRTVLVPSLGELQGQAIADTTPSSIADCPPAEAAPPAEIISPISALLRSGRGNQSDRGARVMAALTADAVWIQETWRLRQVPLHGLIIETRQGGMELSLTFGSDPSAEKLTLVFASAAQGVRWCKEIQERQPQTALDAPPGGRQPPEGVALVRKARDGPYLSLGRVEFTGASKWAGDRGLQLRAGMRGADAIVELYRHNLPGVRGACHASGLAVRVEDADARKRLRLNWYGEEVGALVNRMLLLLAIQGVLLLLAATLSGASMGLYAPTGGSRLDGFVSGALALGIINAWPLTLLALLRILRWPQLLRTTGVVVLAATAGRGAALFLAHLLAVQTTGAALADSKLWYFADPFEWGIAIAGVVLCVRAWRLAGDARQILPEEFQADSTARKVWGRGLFAAAGVCALVLLGFVGFSRYQLSAHLLQPGADPRREYEAMLAHHEGAAHSNKGDLVAAQRSYQRALRLWEGLAARRSAPDVYRVNQALVLCNLGWISSQQGRAGEAEAFYGRAVALGDKLPRSPHVDEAFEQTIAEARLALAQLRGGKSSKLIEEQDKAGLRNYEEAQVKALKGDPAAERQFQDAISAWEEVLPQATNEAYRKDALGRLASAYLELAELQQKLGKLSASETSLKHAIARGEKASALDPDRPYLKHNLELARQRLEGLREQALQEEVERLYKTNRHAEARGVYLRSIEEQEEQHRSGKDRATAMRSLAFRLSRFAWFLAHCPDKQVRDTKLAVKHARRAAELQPDVGEYLYTAAMALYRNGNWGDSLASVEKMKGREGGLDAVSWFLSAMNLHQLNRKAEARAALRKASEWIEERKRQGMDNALLRFQLEMLRPAIESLQQEAENLIEGKAPANQGVG